MKKQNAQSHKKVELKFSINSAHLRQPQPNAIAARRQALRALAALGSLSATLEKPWVKPKFLAAETTLPR